MVRKGNYTIGANAEARVLEFLLNHPSVNRAWSTNARYPDLSFQLHDNRTFGAEVKTIYYIYSNGRRGYAKIPAEELHQTTALKDRIPCMIVELRPKKASDGVLLFVPWEKVLSKFLESEPRMLSLTFWWCLRNGVNLDYWLTQEMKQYNANS